MCENQESPAKIRTLGKYPHILEEIEIKIIKHLKI